MRFDVLVLGAGMVGISTALYLRKVGMSVLLADRRGPGEETSFGNAGVIQREGVHPYLFPRDPANLLAFALNRRPEARYRLSTLPAVLPFLWRYFRASNPKQARRTLAANIPLFARCLTTHGELAAEAGAQGLIRRGGWIEAFRDSRSLRASELQLAELRDLGIDAGRLEFGEMTRLEPHVDGARFAGAVHFRDPWTVSDPGALCQAYAALFIKLGGRCLRGEAMTLVRSSGRWAIDTEEGRASAPAAVVALGPWSKGLLDHLGLHLPMGVKRGYHMHYGAGGNAFLTRPVLDADSGFVLAPMAAGIRLTTGAEFTLAGAPKNPDQIAAALPLARQWFPLAEALDAEAWMGSRPAMPDMLPVVGACGEGELAGLYANFGHAHHGLTLGPATGLLLAEIVAGREPYTDPSPYSPDRFAK
jgi:D-amino-acid dehydrogenase